MRLLISASVALLAILSGSGALAGGSAKIVWSGSFDGGVNDWTAVQAKEGGFSVVSAPGNRSGAAARFVVRPGDMPIGSSGERAEVFKETGEQAGTHSFWKWSVYFAPGATSTPDTSWNVFTQWHQSGPTGVQPVSFEIENRSGRESLRLRVWGGATDKPVRRAWRLAPLVRGKWYDFAVRIDWASDRSGAIQVWLDRRQVVPLTSTPTLYEGQSVYLKQGIYRAPSDVRSELYIADTQRGESLAALGVVPIPVVVAKKVKKPAKPKLVVPARSKVALRPTIIGTAKQGKVLDSSLNSWSSWATHFSYQWQWSQDGGVSWMDVRGATRRTFDVTSTFVGAKVRVVVVAKKAVRTARTASASVSPIA